MLELLVTLSYRVMIILYAVSFPLAIILLVLRESDNIHAEDAPNRFSGILFHFLTIWAVCPFFIVYQGFKFIYRRLS